MASLRNGKTSELTIRTESSEIEPPQPKTLVRRRKSEITGDLTTAEAIAIEELEIAFDDDLRSAIITRLVRDKGLILEAATQERQVSQALELARLEAVDKARSEGKQIARSIMREKKKQQKAAAQKKFIEVELSQLLDSCECLPYESMKRAIDEFARAVGVVLEWKELEDGQFECIPTLA